MPKKWKVEMYFYIADQSSQSSNGGVFLTSMSPKSKTFLCLKNGK